MVRAIVLAGLLAATVAALQGCASHAREPSWPKFHERTADGGESLAPRKPGVIPDEPSDDGDLSLGDIVVDKPAVTKSEEKSVGPEPPAPATIKAPDDILNLDDIIIDLDD